MIQSVAFKEDHTPVLVLGLSFKNLELLKDVGPILVKLKELSLGDGNIVITFVESKNPDHVEIPSGLQGANVYVMAFTDDSIEMLRAGKWVHLLADSEAYSGELIIFSAKDERTMQEMLPDKDCFDVFEGDTCPKCRSGIREDGSCDCKESLN